MPHGVRALIAWSTVAMLLMGCAHDARPIAARGPVTHVQVTQPLSGPPLVFRFVLSPTRFDASTPLPTMTLEVQERRASTTVLCEAQSPPFYCELAVPRGQAYDVRVVDTARTHEGARAYVVVPTDAELIDVHALIDEGTVQALRIDVPMSDILGGVKLEGTGREARLVNESREQVRTFTRVRFERRDPDGIWHAIPVRHYGCNYDRQVPWTGLPVPSGESLALFVDAMPVP